MAVARIMASGTGDHGRHHQSAGAARGEGTEVVYHVAVGIDHEAPAMLQSGEHLPDVGLLTAAGERVRLSDYYGHHLVVQCLRYYG